MGDSGPGSRRCQSDPLVITGAPTVHLTNLQIVFAIFAASSFAAYLLGRRHGRAAERLPEPGKLALGTAQIRRRS